MDFKSLWLCVIDVYLYLTLTIADFMSLVKLDETNHFKGDNLASPETNLAES